MITCLPQPPKTVTRKTTRRMNHAATARFIRRSGRIRIHSGWVVSRDCVLWSQARAGRISASFPLVGAMPQPCVDAAGFRAHPLDVRHVEPRDVVIRVRVSRVRDSTLPKADNCWSARWIRRGGIPLLVDFGLGGTENPLRRDHGALASGKQHGPRREGRGRARSAVEFAGLDRDEEVREPLLREG